MKNRRSLRPLLLAVILLLPLLPLSAAADSLMPVTELIKQAEAGWHQSYQSPAGEVRVDIPILMPKVGSLPVLRVRALSSSVVPLTKDMEIFDWGDEKPRIANYDGYFQYAGPDFERRTKAEEENPAPEDIMTYSRVLYAEQAEEDVAYALKNPATVRDMDRLRDEMLARFFPGEELHFEFDMLEADVRASLYDWNRDEELGPGWPEYRGSLIVSYNQLLREIPFLSSIEKAYREPYVGKLENEIFSKFKGQSYACCWPLDHFGLAGEVLIIVEIMALKEDGVLVEDMKVCGIDKVLAAYGRLIEKGELIRVDRLQLGYVGWYESRESETMRLLPMWMAEGYMTRPSTRKRGKDPSTLGIRDAEHSYIMVNAQTGELIDYRREDRKRSYDMPEILP